MLRETSAAHRARDRGARGAQSEATVRARRGRSGETRGATRGWGCSSTSLGEGGDGERFGKGAESVVGDVDGAERETREGSLGEGLDPVVVQLEALEDGEAGDGVGEDGDVVVGGDERDELARLPPRGGGGGGVEADGLWWGTRGRGRRAGVTERAACRVGSRRGFAREGPGRRWNERRRAPCPSPWRSSAPSRRDSRVCVPGRMRGEMERETYDGVPTLEISSATLLNSRVPTRSNR